MGPALPDAGVRKRAVVVGIGNPCYGDDGVGPAAARAAHALLNANGDWDLRELCCSAFGVVEHLEGYERAVIVDAVVVEEAREGMVLRVELREPAAPVAALHTAGLTGALALARQAGMRLPARLSVYGITIRPPNGFREGLSAGLEARIPEIARTIVEMEGGLIPDGGNK